MSVNQLKASEWTKDGRKWVFQTRYTDLSGKVQKHKSKKFFTKKEAQEAERLFFLELDKYRGSNDMTFKELYLAFYEYQKDKVKATTNHTYTDRMRYMELLDNIKVKDFTIQHYEQWRKKILEYNLSNRTRNYIYKFLKSIMNFGTKWYNLNFNQVYNKMTNFTDPNEIKKEMEFWTYEEFSKFIEVEEDLTYKTFFKTLYFCGFRKGEIRALNWNDIDFYKNTIRINKGLSDNVNGQRYIITSPKTASSNREIPLIRDLVDDLKKMQEQAKTFKNYKDSWFVFGNELPLGDDAIRRHKNNNCVSAGVKQIRIHDFRHSCASLLINNSADITLVAKYLGHSKIEETLNTYSHMFKNKLNNIMGLIDDLNDKAKGITKSNNEIEDLKDLIANQRIEITRLNDKIFNLENEVSFWKNKYHDLTTSKEDDLDKSIEKDMDFSL
ncbi:MAG: site-specific integrase [Bacilli bacterium]|nr:site-specific integrase [Bacilli bacterium]